VYFLTNINLLINIYIIFYSYLPFIQKSLYKFTCLILKTNISLSNLTYFLILTDFILVVIRKFIELN
jgi:hypothetical protein